MIAIKRETLCFFSRLNLLKKEKKKKSAVIKKKKGGGEGRKKIQKISSFFPLTLWYTFQVFSSIYNNYKITVQYLITHFT